MLFTCIGVYSTHNNAFDAYVLLGIGLVGFLMLLVRFEVVPILLGLVLGPILEENFRRALLLSRGDFHVFIERPITATALGVCVLMVVGSVWGYSRRRPRADAQPEPKAADA